MPRVLKPYLEVAGWIGLAGLTVLFLALSWRAWPDPLIDYGREVYTPWRLAQGAVLYRDVDAIYGPLSQYFDALLFALLGRGMMVLVGANLVIFAGMVAAICALFRMAWGAGAAWVASAIFIAVFGFSHFDRGGNYNYATPYSHETTHGLLVCLLLVAVWIRWLEYPSRGWIFAAGFLLGLTAVLKAEIFLAAGWVTVAAALISWRAGKQPDVNSLAVWAIGLMLPTLGFVAYFSAFLSWDNAMSAACRGWLNAVTTTRYTGYSLQLWFFGFDHPWPRFLNESKATLEACLLIGVIAGTAWLTDRMVTPWVRVFIIGALIFLMAAPAWYLVDWFEVGRCLLGLNLIYAVRCLVLLGGGIFSRRQVARALISVLAVALMVRMVLNGRIYQYGYYQAALAGVLVPAVLIGELPDWLAAGRWAKVAVIVGSLALLLPGVVILIGYSQSNLQWKFESVGEGRDRFYTFPPQVDATGSVVQAVLDALRKAPPDQTLLVLPEGEMINYLANRPSTVAPYCFFAMATADGREDQIVMQLQAKPPDWVVIISRDLREYGIKNYGEEPDNGQQLFRWVKANYQVVGSVGGDPFDHKQRGALILQHRS